MENNAFATTIMMVLVSLKIGKRFAIWKVTLHYIGPTASTVVGSNSSNRDFTL